MALRLERISKSYGGREVLRDVSLHVRPGDCYGFLGHNGAGKTTALRIALGLVPADTGRVVTGGFDAADHPLAARARSGGLIEVPGFHGSLTGRRNLFLLARVQGLGRDAARAECDRVLGLVGLSDAADRAAGTYSQGMRQRLGIAQALLGRPAVVLLDEPLNGLDPEGIEEMRRLLRRLTRDEGTAVLLSSHQLADVADVCNRVGILKQGRMLLEEETGTLLGGAKGRYVLRAAGPGSEDGLRRALAAAGLPATARPDGAIETDLGGRPPADVARALVAAGAAFSAFAPKPRTLEDVYLTCDGSASPPAPDTTAPTTPPVPEAAPAAPVLRTARYELSRWFAGPAVPLLLVAPAAASVACIVHASAEAKARAADVASGKVFSTSQTTGFTALALGLAWGLPLLAAVVASIGSQSVAGESARGTLRNLALRPVGRGRIVAGKLLALSVAAVAAFALTEAASWAAAGASFGFGDLVEILPNGVEMPLQKASDVWPDAVRASWMPAVAVLAYASLGVLVGSVARSAAGAMAAAIGLVAVLVVGLAFAPSGALPSSHLPWWQVRDLSPVRRLFDVSQGVSNALPADAAGPWWGPWAWLAGAAGLGAWLMRRRAIP
ncbi:MAG: Vitamin B12 import ATP-binding protein BtuD [Planctomycetes bacterium]|nr:Vitamin B12 import ATP-binding protein BtuD [Planctomycetota bacterium]